METNVRILQLCPNVEHVEIRGFEASELDALVNVLKRKSRSSLSKYPHRPYAETLWRVREATHIFLT